VLTDWKKLKAYTNIGCWSDVSFGLWRLRRKQRKTIVRQYQDQREQVCCLKRNLFGMLIIPIYMFIAYPSTWAQVYFARLSVTRASTNGTTCGRCTFDSRKCRTLCYNRSVAHRKFGFWICIVFDNFEFLLRNAKHSLKFIQDCFTGSFTTITFRAKSCPWLSNT
jgi:hypothetical protein